MRKPVASIAFAAALAADLVLGACASRTGAPPYPPVPALIVEVLPKPPVSQTPLIWKPGHWDWTGNGYVWIPGEYVPRAGRSGLWMQGYWSGTPTGGWAWMPAHWL